MKHWIVELGCGLLACLLIGLILGPFSGLKAQSLFGDDARPVAPGNPGYVIISTGLDSTRGFAWQWGPGPGQRSLTWADGVLTLPDTMEVESLRGVDLGIPCTGFLAGLGHSGQLVFQDGIYKVSEPVFISDGTLQLYVTAGELEVKGQRIRYSGPVEKNGDPRAGYVFLAGMILLVVVLLRRAALRSRNKN